MTSVLVVDDSKFLAKALARILASNDFHVAAVAHDGHEGLAAYLEHRPDVTLLDITMPNMDGLECLSQILESDPDARVVMLSAIQDEEIIARCREAGAIDYLSKPIRGTDPEDIERLTSTLKNAAAATIRS